MNKINLLSLILIANNHLCVAEIGSTNDDLQSRVAQAMPFFGGQAQNFGGFFYAEQGNTLAVYLKHGDEQAAAVKAIQYMLGTNLKTKNNLVLPAQYSIAELKEIADRATAVLNIEGVNYFDRIDETKNRIGLGIESENALEKIKAALLALKLPIEAFNFEIAPAAQQLLSLRDIVRPIIGAVRIAWQLPLYSNFCTLGIPVSATDSSFITNSHCSINPQELDDTIYYQPDVPSKEPSPFGLGPFLIGPIGVKLFDPPLFSGEPCPDGRRCRYSDAALATLTGAGSERGRIARTSGWGQIDITGAYRIVERHLSIAGELLVKVGATTGETHGEVSKTCVDILSPRPGELRQTFLCQDQVHRLAGESRDIAYWGDSGSPVFFVRGNTGEVELAGLVWGSPDRSSFYYSPIALIEQELGQLRLCHMDTPCSSDP